jgi:hypothetical protein|tara:strand:- start:549 stop:752 length:204 start_codon:yes stop_codon:yes gene_type:complete
VIPFLYLACLFAIGGGAFALMWANIKSINEMNTPIKTKRHPEAPAAGEEVMYVDLSREKLERLYDEN